MTLAVIYPKQPWLHSKQSSLLENPHVLQSLYVPNNPSHMSVSRTDIPFTRLLQHSSSNSASDAPRGVYRSRRSEPKTVVHHGQRKLLIQEIELLTMHARPGSLVVYVGAACGTHLGILITLFPQCSFLCIDPAPFVPAAYIHTTDQHPRVRLVNYLFDDNVARLIRANQLEAVSAFHNTPLHQHPVDTRTIPPDPTLDIIFISDIRTGEMLCHTDGEIEDCVKTDMQAQWDWHKILRPRVSMLKMRLPWDSPGTTEYLDGELYLPVWGPTSTTETRLVVQDPTGMSTKLYDNVKYEQQMFYFNTNTRICRYNHSMQADGFDHCYDCTAEASILQLYIDKYPHVASAYVKHGPRRSTTKTHNSSNPCSSNVAPTRYGTLADRIAAQTSCTTATQPSYASPGQLCARITTDLQVAKRRTTRVPQNTSDDTCTTHPRADDDIMHIRYKRMRLTRKT